MIILFRIVDNRDKELMEEAEAQLQRNKLRYGKRYCPCKLERNDDTVCPCKEFREQFYEGECHCGRYEKVLT